MEWFDREIPTCFGCEKDEHVVCNCHDTVDDPKKDTRGWTGTPDPNGKELLRNHDKDWFWCSKCSRWNLTHKISQYVKKSSTLTNTFSAARTVLTKETSSPSQDDSTLQNGHTSSITFAHLVLDGLQKWWCGFEPFKFRPWHQQLYHSMGVWVMFRLIICLLSLLVYLVSFGLINLPIVSLTSFNLLNNKFTNRNVNLFSVNSSDLQNQTLPLVFDNTLLLDIVVPSVTKLLLLLLLSLGTIFTSITTLAFLSQPCFNGIPPLPPIVNLTSFNLLNNKFTNRNFNLFTVNSSDLQNQTLPLVFDNTLLLDIVVPSVIKLLLLLLLSLRTIFTSITTLAFLSQPCFNGISPLLPN